MNVTTKAKTPPTPEEMLRGFESHVADSIGPDGMRLNKCTFWNWCTQEMIFIALDLRPDQIFFGVINLVDSDVTDYLLLAVDMTSLPDQGLEFDDFVLVCEFDRRRPEPFLTSQWRYGVINYRKGDDATKIVRPIDWNNAVWHKLGAAHMHRLGPPFRCRVQRDRSKPQPAEKDGRYVFPCPP